MIKSKINNNLQSKKIKDLFFGAIEKNGIKITKELISNKGKN